MTRVRVSAHLCVTVGEVGMEVPLLSELRRERVESRSLPNICCFHGAASCRYASASNPASASHHHPHQQKERSSLIGMPCRALNMSTNLDAWPCTPQWSRCGSSGGRLSAQTVRFGRDCKPQLLSRTSRRAAGAMSHMQPPRWATL